MTPETPPHIAPEKLSLSAVSPSLTREALVEQLAGELQKLETLCLPPPKVAQQSLMRFRCEEFAEVQATWDKGGIQAVIHTWGDQRTFARGEPSALKHLPTPPKSNEQYPLILAVNEFVPDPSPNPVQCNYFRSRSFELSAHCKDEIRSMLDDSGISEGFWPDVDSATHASLADASLKEIECSAHWYGPENLYGDGMVLRMTLSLRPLGQEELYLRLSLDRRGTLTRSVWAAESMETGYEGHDHLSKQLTADELRAFLPIVSQIHTETPTPSTPFVIGTWIANSFLPIE